MWVFGVLPNPVLTPNHVGKTCQPWSDGCGFEWIADWLAVLVGASGMPIYLDVNIAMAESGRRPLITGATYGLASKEFTPAMVKAVFDNLNAPQPRMQYVVGIEDDVTHSSLEYGAPISTTPETTKQCLFWGLGSDGTVGANKTAIKVIGLNTDLKAQGHFVFDSHKVRT